jgi:hypothetical protein
MRSPSPERSHPWGQGGLPPIDQQPYYPPDPHNIGVGHPTRAPPLGAMFQNRSLDRSVMHGTGARRGLDNYRSESGRNWSQPSLAINRLIGSATGGVGGGRRLPQPPPESQKPLAMPLPNTPLPMNQKPVALSFRNRKLPQVPANANFGIGGGPIGVPNTMTTSVTKTRPSVRNSKSFNIPFAGAFGGGGGGGNNAAISAAANRSSRGAKLPIVPGTQPAAAAATGEKGTGFWGAFANRRHLPDRAGPQSRSLDYNNPPGVGGGPTLETVVEAGRGVRKLPAQPVVGGHPGLLRQNGTVTNQSNLPVGNNNGYLPNISNEADFHQIRQPEWT